MIIDHQYFDLNNKTVIEKLVVKTPMKQRPVFQNEACFLYFKDGESIISSANETLIINREESVLLKCGNYFGDIIQKAPSGICEVYVIHLFPEMLKEIYKDEMPVFVKQNLGKAYAQRIAKHSVIKHFIDSLSFYFENPQLVTTELLQLKLKELVLLLLQTTNGETIFDLFTNLFTPRKASIIEVIDAHLYSALTLDQLATLAGLSLSTFKREFQKHFNETPANYIRSRRMQKASELLIISDFSVSEISYQVGYDDSSYFSRLFSQTFNLSPSEYRIQHKI